MYRLLVIDNHEKLVRFSIFLVHFNKCFEPNVVKHISLSLGKKGKCNDFGCFLATMFSKNTSRVLPNAVQYSKKYSSAWFSGDLVTVGTFCL